MTGVFGALAGSVWASLGNGTLLVVVTAVVIWIFGRRLPPGAQAVLWTIALVKFIVPCGPSVAGSLSRTLQLAGEPVPIEPRQAVPVEIEVALLLIYVPIVMWLAARAVRGYTRLVERARSLPAVSEAMWARIDACARRLGIEPPDARTSDEPVSPHVVGLLEPVLIVPAWLDSRGDAAEAFLLHELAHLQRRDHWLLVGLVIVETLFFFWPPVLWAAARLRGAREAACDATAVAHGPLGAAAYARSLLGAARACAARPACALVLSGAVTSRLEERIDFLVRGPRRLGRVWGAAVLALWLAWALGGGQRVVEEPPEVCGNGAMG